MSVCATAKRRRRQAVQGYRHMSPQRRPHYKTRDVTTAQRRLEMLIKRERERQARGKK